MSPTTPNEPDAPRIQAALRLEHELLAVETEHDVHAMLELEVPEAAGAGRAPLSLALVLDRSGSMAGPKLETAKRCAAYLAERLGRDDRFAVVTYDDQVALLHPLEPVDPHAARLHLMAIYPGGSTNLSGGWLKGTEVLRGTEGEGVKRLLLLTDGLANVGVVDARTLAAMAGSALEHEGVSTTTIGFGDGFDEDLLTAMADAGRGGAYYAATPDAAPAIFATEFEGLATLIAQNLSVEIRPGPDVQVLSVLNEFPQLPVPGGVQLHLGDAYGGERRRVVFELHVPNIAALGPAKVADVVVRWVSVGAEIAAHEATLPLVVNLVSADEAAAGVPDAEVVEQVVVLKSARAAEEARSRADAGDYEAAQTLLRDAAAELRRRAPGSTRAEELLSQAAEYDEVHGMMSGAAYSREVRKRMTYATRDIRQQRRRP